MVLDNMTQWVDWVDVASHKHEGGTFNVFPDYPKTMSRENRERVFHEMMSFVDQVMEALIDDAICDLTGCLDAPIP